MALCALQPFDGSLRQAQGILSVEEATFGECPYSPEQIACLLNQPTQHAVVALHGARVLAFVAGFETETIAGHNLEVDLLAVHPGAQGQGIGCRLLGRAGALSAALGARRARGLVGASNSSSEKAFLKAEYVPCGSAHLLVCGPGGQTASAGRHDPIGVSPLSRFEEFLAPASLRWEAPLASRFLGALLAGLRTHRRQEVQDRVTAPGPRGLDLTERIVARLLSDVEEDGARLLLVFVPTPMDTRMRRVPAREGLTRLAASLGVPFADPTPRFATAAREQGLDALYVDGFHCTRMGYDLVVDAVHELFPDASHPDSRERP